MKKLLFCIVACLFVFSMYSACATSVLTFKIEPKKHDFGQVNIGTTASFDFIITNNKSVDMTLTTISFLTNEFTEITSAQGKSITAKNSLVITAQFTPVLPGGNKSDTMHIDWVDLNGKIGSKDIAITGEAIPVPEINLSTSTIDFGIVLIGQHSDIDVDVENTGTADLILNLLNFSAFSAEFSISNGGTTPVTVIPGATHTITVRFTPLTDGSKPSILQITHNAMNLTNPAAVDITAQGISWAPEITLNQTSPWAIGETVVTTTSTHEFEISSTGINDLEITSIATVTGTEFSFKGVLDSARNPITLPQVVTVSDFIYVLIDFAPTANGAFNDTIQIVHDGINLASPLDLAISGTGRVIITQTFNYTGSIDNWTIPAGVTSVNIETWGAQGGNSSPALGGKGARMKGDFTVSPGATIKILVGQQGVHSVRPTSSGYSAGGGGGSFVATSSNQPMIVAGGGGGAGVMSSSPQNIAQGDDAVTTQDGTDGKPGTRASGGTGGNGAGNYANTGATGGAGFLTDSANYASGYGGPASAFVNGGAGAIQANTGGNGGFGGGGAGAYGGGGGGGYSGGAHGDFTPSRDMGAGAGGSFNNGSNTSNSPGIKTDNGQIIIKY